MRSKDHATSAEVTVLPCGLIASRSVKVTLPSSFFTYDSASSPITSSGLWRLSPAEGSCV